MNPWLVSGSQVSVIGPAICVLDVHVAPPSAEVEDPTSSWISAHHIAVHRAGQQV